MQTKHYLSFFVGDDEYGLDIEESRAILQFPTITPIPSMPAAILGFTSMRGSIVPVVDLSVLSGRRTRPTTPWTCVIVVEVPAAEGERSRIGLVVDRVSQVIEVRAEDVEPVPTFGTSVSAKFLRGIGKVGAEFVHLLELSHVVEEMR